MRKLVGFFLLFMCIAMPKLLLAQKKRNGGGSKSYEIVRNSPEEARNLHFGISPFYLDVGNEISSGFSGEINYNFHNTFSAITRLQYSYADTRTTGNDLRPFTSFEIGGVYYFLKKDREKTQDVIVKSESGGSNNTIKKYYIPVKANENILYGARLGYQQVFSTVNAGFYNPLILDYNNTATTYADGISTETSMGMVNIGISRSRISDLFINVKGLGERKGITAQRDMYLDVLYAPTIQFSEVQIAAPAPGAPSTGEINEDQPVKKMGFRAGINTYSTKFIGLNYGFETGIRPGTGSRITQNIFATFRVVLNISTRI